MSRIWVVANTEQLVQHLKWVMPVVENQNRPEYARVWDSLVIINIGRRGVCLSWVFEFLTYKRRLPPPSCNANGKLIDYLWYPLFLIGPMYHTTNFFHLEFHQKYPHPNQILFLTSFGIKKSFNSWGIAVGKIFRSKFVLSLYITQVWKSP